MKNLFCLFFLFFLALNGAFAQGKVSGNLIDHNKKPVAYASMMLLNARDSALVRGAITDEAGHYEFDESPAGNYLVEATMVGYKEVYSAPFALAAKDVAMAVLSFGNDAATLQEVTVSTRKPFVERKLDRTVVNVENSIVSAGSTAMEVLKRAPGVQVDKDDNISLRGKQGVIIMIDDKPTYLSSKDVANMMKSLSSESLESIELITNPSAKYDAAGTAGIINIKLKRPKKPGLNGSINGGLGFVRNTSYHGGFSLNYRNKKVNLFGSYQYNHHTADNTTDLVRYIHFENAVSVFRQLALQPNSTDSHSAKVGLDYYFDKNNTLGVLANGMLHDSKSNNDNHTVIENEDHSLQNSLTNYTANTGHLTHGSVNLNYKSNLDTAGKVLTVDADYAHFQNKNDQLSMQKLFSSDGNLYGNPYQLRSAQPNEIDIKSIKTDYTQPLKHGMKLEAGLKSSLVKTDNDVKMDTFHLADWQTDYSKTNHFQYTENINAGYVNFSKEFQKTSLMVGLRVEQTNSQGNSITLGKVVNRSYWDFFPSLFLTHKFSDNHQVGISYSRRIQRPSYQDLNPFISYLDSYTYQQGNPFLRPQYTHSLELNYTLMQAWNFVVGYSHTSDVFSIVTKQNDTTKVTYAINENLKNLDAVNLGLSAPIPIRTWWMMNNYFYLNYNRYSSNYLGGDFNNEGFNWGFNTQNEITLPWGLTLEVTGMYNSAQVWGLFKVGAMWQVGAGLEKTFLKKKASLKLSADDVFFSMKSVASIQYQNMDLKITDQWRGSRLRLSFTYRFGGENAFRQRRSGASDEQDRVKMGK